MKKLPYGRYLPLIIAIWLPYDSLLPWNVVRVRLDLSLGCKQKICKTASRRKIYGVEMKSSKKEQIIQDC